MRSSCVTPSGVTVTRRRDSKWLLRWLSQTDAVKRLVELVEGGDIKQLARFRLAECDSECSGYTVGAVRGMGEPRLVLLFSGKRKSGKDHVTNSLQLRFSSDTCSVLRLSGPLKEQFALERGLDYERLLGATGYKEEFRADMIRWGEEKRRRDPGFFCRIIVQRVSQPVWIISDARRKSDIDWFRSEYGAVLQTVRVEASEETREARGWVYTPGG
ncbi:hypothetical protein XELAEV_18040904mg [Xenopus laevis]|uniref:Phosphomevalonate kinase n=2 Tax=Xenopus laevis TaxID=8355 RepID=A0A974CAL8_XENLA|nr:hypothetical protein XELAEV_18040904mg [Xenopus laevis]